MDGCKRGSPCKESRQCGDYDKEGTCTNCTFVECEQRAQNLNSFAFSYGISNTQIAYRLITHTTVCQMCNEVEFKTRRTVFDTLNSTFGIYRGPKKGKFLVIC